MLEYLHAVSLLIRGKNGSLQKIHDKFNGDWQQAWSSDLSSFMAKDTNHTSLKRDIDPPRAYHDIIKAKIDIITIYDNNYPALLKEIADPPFLLYIRGNTKLLNSFCFGVVGTRNASEYGKRSATYIIEELARNGVTIVSGLASGIDTLAHSVTISENAKTIAVLGSGVADDVIFPSQNIGLGQKIIAKGGAVISEYPPSMQAAIYTFPQRNRIISGLSKGVLVVEADIKSGSLITARCALEQNRDVFAVPGSIFSKTSRGTNMLLQKGAKIVTSAQDIFDEYQTLTVTKQPQLISDDPQEMAILKLISNEPLAINAIIEKTGFQASQVNALLVVMEIKRKIKNLGNNRYACIN